MEVRILSEVLRRIGSCQASPKPSFHGREIGIDLDSKLKVSGKKLTAEYTLADALFEGKTNVSLAEQLFSLPVSKVPASL